MTYFNELKNHVLISKKVTDRLFYPSIKKTSLISYFQTDLTHFIISILFSATFASIQANCPDGFLKNGQSCYMELNILSTWAEASVRNKTRK